MRLILPTFTITLVLLISSCSQEEVHIAKSYKTYSTLTGSITVKDDIVAMVEWKQTSNLAFRSAGIVSSLSVLPGEYVKKWQILARLGNRESSIQSNAFWSIENELQDLSRSTTIVRIGTENVKKSTEKLYDERVKSIDIDILSLENTLQKTKQDFNNQTNSLWNSFESFAQNFDRISTSMLYEWDKILGITTNFEHSNDGWEAYLGTRVGNAKGEAENEWNNLYVLRGKIRSYIEIWATIPDIRIATQDLRTALVWARSYAKSMTYMFQNSVLGWGLVEETLNAWLATWSSLSADEQTSEANFITWRNNNLHLTDSSIGSGSIADKSIVSLELELSNLKQSRATLLAEKEAKVNEVKTNVDSVKSKKGEVSVQLAETRMNASLARESSEYSIIRAPYDGVILEKLGEEGMVIWAWIPLIKISSTDSTLAKIYLDNSLYQYEEWKAISGVIPDTEQSISGTISLIQEQRDPIHNKNYAEIQLEWDVAIGTKITIHLERKKSNFQNGILIPLWSIISRYGPPGVYILEDKKVRFQNIEVLGSDMSYAEVLGIKEGAQIVTDGKENIYDGEVLE